MGAVATRLMLEKGVDVVGALARSPAKVGKDLGEVADLGTETGSWSRIRARGPSDRGTESTLPRNLRR
jgi:hypothetical protein